ncbi:MAG: hypothetical protein ABIB79_02870 [archaeon]
MILTRSNIAEVGKVYCVGFYGNPMVCVKKPDPSYQDYNYFAFKLEGVVSRAKIRKDRIFIINNGHVRGLYLYESPISNKEEQLRLLKEIQKAGIE